MVHTIDIGYNYLPLNPSRREIRILLVTYQDYYDTTPLTCRLVHISLDDLDDREQPLWVAISYCWGDATELKSANIDGQPAQIPDHADAALRNYMDDESFFAGVFPFWIDVICIDQTNIQERNEQVQLMGNIYSSAPRVFIWLGRNNGEHAESISDLLLRFDNIWTRLLDSRGDPEGAVRNLQTAGEELFSSMSEPEWKALDSLYCSPWFKRTWIIQEAVLPKGKVIVRMGRSFFRWRPITVLATCRQLLDVERYADILDVLTTPAWDGLRYAYRIGQISDMRRLSDLLIFTSETVTTDPRDKVFGLLGLLEESSTYQIEIDYNTTLIELFAATTRAAITEERSPKILLESFSRSPSDDYYSVEIFPSWVVPCHWPSTPLVCRVEYESMGVTDSTKHFEYPNSDLGNVLRVKGVILDEISTRSALIARSPGGDSLEFSKAEKFYYLKEHLHNVCMVWILAKSALPLQDELLVSRELCTVLLHTRASGNIRAELDYEVFTKFSALEQKLSVPVGHEGNKTEIELYSHTKSTLLDVYRTSTGRYLVDTTHGRIASAWPSARPGDKICLLFGCNTPFVLREEGDHWILVGDAQLYNLMDGEYLLELEEKGMLESESRFFDIH